MINVKYDIEEKNMKKVAAVVLMIVCCFNFVFADVTDELNKAYDRVNAEFPEFIERLINEGAQESDIRSFITDMGKELTNMQGLNRDNFESKMAEVLKNVLLSGKYNNLQGAVNRAYFDEINDLMETGKIPESMLPLKDILMDCILNLQNNGGSGGSGNGGSGNPGGSSGGNGSIDSNEPGTDNPDTNQEPVKEASLNLNEAYHVISILYPEFIDGFLNEGVTEEEIRSFLADVGTELSKIEGLNQENFESNMKTVLANVLLSGRHNNLQNVMQKLYFDDILDMMSTGKLPEKFIPLKDTLMACLLDKDAIGPLFTDVESGHWAYPYVQDMAIKGVIQGKGGRLFEPDSAVTREEFVKMIAAAKGIDLNVEGISNPFSDVHEGQWYYAYVLAAYRDGMITGTGADTFGSGQKIARQDAAVILARVLSAKDTSGTELFSDDAQISGYAKDSVYALSKLGIIGGMGDGSFQPFGETTRAQAAKILSALNE